MILLGGVTRLTGSGLSITEWKPISGIVPPLSKADLEIEFDKYKASPEFIKVNSGMTLSEFGSIFWMEFTHRMLARIICIIYLIPLIYFIRKGFLSHKSLKIHIAASFLLAAQGYAGWYMVKSGLTNEPQVNHLRLAVHLMIAISIYGLLFTEYLRYSQAEEVNYKIINNLQSTLKLKILSRFLLVTCIILYLQIMLGAFTAGLKAGLIYNTFPLMGDSLIPLELRAPFKELFDINDPIFIQFLHRSLASITMVAVFICGLGMIFKTPLPIPGYLMLFSVSIQFCTGIYTLLLSVPLILGCLHQVGAIALFSSLLLAYVRLSQAHIIDQRDTLCIK
jgi:cytochrome c oxidase assembly protein subunit 15